MIILYIAILQTMIVKANKQKYNMKTIIISILFILIGNFNAYAYENPQGNISKEEFRKKQKEFFIREAQLTPKEANYFFPLYFELQDKKKVLTDDANSKRNKALKQELDELQYKAVIDQIMNIQVKLEKLEQEYIDKYRKVLSNKKIFKIMTTEVKFRKEMLKSMRKSK